jgi:hypothetical protein
MLLARAAPRILALRRRQCTQRHTHALHLFQRLQSDSSEEIELPVLYLPP